MGQCLIVEGFSNGSVKSMALPCGLAPDRIALAMDLYVSWVHGSEFARVALLDLGARLKSSSDERNV